MGRVGGAREIEGPRAKRGEGGQTDAGLALKERGGGRGVETRGHDGKTRGRPFGVALSTSTCESTLVLPQE